MTTRSLNTIMSPLHTLVLLFGVALVVGGLMWLYDALGFSLAMTAFGSLFLLYWAGIKHRVWGEYLPSLVGGMVGITLAWILLAVPDRWGSPGALASSVLLVVVLYFYLRGQGRFLVNNASMLLLLVATIPESLFENAQGWAIRRSMRLPSAMWIMASETSRRCS